MGKVNTLVNAKKRHNPLFKDIESVTGNLKSTTSSKVKSGHSQNDFYDPATSRKILKLAKDQQDEIDADNDFQPKIDLEEEDGASDSDADAMEFSSLTHEMEDYEGEPEVSEELTITNARDRQLIDQYFGGKDTETITLADKIMAKIHEKELMREAENDGRAPKAGVLLPPKVIAAYSKIGQILSTYRHGKLPKLFKVLPTLKNWEDVLFVTKPESWTPHAVYEATKLFVSNLPANEAQIFVESVLLPKFRQSIEDSETHSLDYHLYRSLKKSLYKPSAFFKGFLLPLVDDQCSNREAMIVASVLSKVSIPSLHSSVALTQLTQRDYTPARTVFIRCLIDKKYALPYQTLDDLVFYFMRFRLSANDDPGLKELAILPIVWYKAFLAFAQRYKNDITDDQRDFLLETLRQRFHPAIGPEIRRELISGSSRPNMNVDNL